VKRVIVGGTVSETADDPMDFIPLIETIHDGIRRLKELKEEPLYSGIPPR